MTASTPPPPPSRSPGLGGTAAPPGLIDCWVRGAGVLAFPAAWQTVALAIAAALILVVAVSVGAGWGLSLLPWIAEGWSALAGWMGGGLALILGIVLFPAIFAACVGLLLDRVADAVDRAAYAHLPPARSVPVAEQIGETVRFLALLIAANLVAFVTVMAIPLLNLAVWFALNGFLLGRELFDLAAIRRMSKEDRREVRRRYRGSIWALGLILGLSLSIPLLNLLTPVIGTAAMVHFVNRLPGLARSGPRFAVNRAGD